jgi:hypothetical protein
VKNCVFDHQFPVHPHCVVIYASGTARERKKRKKTPHNDIAQHTDHAISRTNALRLLFAINTKFKQRSLPGNEREGEKADYARDWKNVKSSQQ